MSGKRWIGGNTDIFVGGDGSGLGFRTGVGEEPARKSTGEAARNGCAGRTGGGNRSAAQVAGRVRRRVFKVGLRLVVNFRLDSGRRRCRRRLSAVFGERFAGEKDGFFGDSARCGRTDSFWRAMIEAALRWAAGFETARLAATIFLATVIAAAVFVAARVVAARFATLRRSVFRGREVASAGTLRAATTMTSATTTETAPAAIATAVTTTIVAAVVAPAVILAAAIAAAAGARRVILSGIVMWRKILRRGSIRFRLALVFFRDMGFVVHFGAVFQGQLIARRGFFDNAGLVIVRQRIVLG